MLGKLIKHELNTTGRLMIPVNVAILVITLVGCIILSTNIFSHDGSEPLAILLIILYGLFLMALGLITVVYLLVRFYKNLFTKEGYLMFTLPVTPIQLLHSKLITAYFWSVINTFLTILSVLALIFTAGYHSANGLSLYGTSGSSTASALFFKELFGYTPSMLVLFCSIILLVGCFSSLTMGYLSIALGQLIEKYKLACSIAFYISFSIVMQVITSIVIVICNTSTIINAHTDDINGFIEITRNIYRSILPISGIISLVCGILFYLLTIVIMKKKVNLD